MEAAVDEVMALANRLCEPGRMTTNEALAFYNELLSRLQDSYQVLVDESEGAGE